MTLKLIPPTGSPMAPQPHASTLMAPPAPPSDVYNPLLDDDDTDEAAPVGRRIATQPPATTTKPTVAAPANKAATEPEKTVQGTESGAEESAEPRRLTAVERKRKAVEENRTGTSRFKLKDTDMVLINFIGETRYVNSEVAGRLLGVPALTAGRRMDKLFVHGYLDKKVVPGRYSLYFLTDLGASLCDREPTKVRSSFGVGISAHTIEVNRIHASLLSGHPCELTPLKVTPDDVLVSEPVIASAMYQHIEVQNFGLDYADQVTPEELKGLKEAAMKPFRTGGFAGEAPELALFEEWLFVPCYDIARDYHVPDLVVARPRTREGSPRSVAIEVELSAKKPRELHAIMRAFKKEFESSDGTLCAVYYVYKNSTVRAAVQKAAKHVGLTREQIKFIGLEGASSYALRSPKAGA